MSSDTDEEHGNVFTLPPLPSSPVHAKIDDVARDSDPPTSEARADGLCSRKRVIPVVVSDKGKAILTIAEATKRGRHTAGNEGIDKPATKKSPGVVFSDETDGNMLLRVDKCEGKGRAVFSSKEIKKGARIILDGVLWWIKSESAKDQKNNYEHEYKLFIDKYCTPEAIADGRAAKVMRDIEMLQNSITQRRQTNADKYRHIFEINGWTHKNGTVVAVAVGSLINHSCVPDFKVGFDMERNHMLLTAKKKVENAREVSVSYISKSLLDGSVDKRQEALFSWGFYCRCEKCVTETAMHMKKADSNKQSAKIICNLAIIESNHMRRCQENKEHQDSDKELQDSDADGYSDEEMSGTANATAHQLSIAPPLPVSCRITHKFAPFLPGTPRIVHRSSAPSVAIPLPVSCRMTHRFAPFLPGTPRIVHRSSAPSVVLPLPVSCRMTHRFAPFSPTMPQAQVPAPRTPTISKLRQRMQPMVPKPHPPSSALEYGSSSQNMQPFLQQDAVERLEAQQKQKKEHDTLMEQTREEIDAQQHPQSHYNAHGGMF